MGRWMKPSTKYSAWRDEEVAELYTLAQTLAATRRRRCEIFILHHYENPNDFDGDVKSCFDSIRTPPHFFFTVTCPDHSDTKRIITLWFVFFLFFSKRCWRDCTGHRQETAALAVCRLGRFDLITHTHFTNQSRKPTEYYMYLNVNTVFKMNTRVGSLSQASGRD